MVQPSRWSAAPHNNLNVYAGAGVVRNTGKKVWAGRMAHTAMLTARTTHTTAASATVGYTLIY